MLLQLPHEPSRFCRWERGVQDRRRVRIQLIRHQPDRRGIGIMDIHQLLQALCKVQAGPPLGHFDVPPASQRLEEQEQIARPFPLVFVIVACRFGSFDEKEINVR